MHRGLCGDLKKLKNNAPPLGSVLLCNLQTTPDNPHMRNTGFIGDSIDLHYNISASDLTSLINFSLLSKNLMMSVL